MGTVETISRCKWPAVANEANPELKRHWLLEAGILNRTFSDFVLRVAENGVVGNDFEDGSIPEASFDADLSSKVGLDDGAVTVRKLANGILAATTAGRAAMADGYLTTAKFGAEQITAGLLATAIGAYAVPVGAVVKMAGETPPNNWIECAGQVLAIASYPALYGAIGTLHGTGGTGTFKIPDMRGYFPRGWDHGTTNDPDRATRTGGDRVGSSQGDAVMAHTHTITSTLLNHSGSASSYGQYNGVTNNITFTTNPMTPSEGRPKNKAFMYCIRVR